MSQIKTKFVEDLAITNAKVATGLDATKVADGSVTNAEFQYINSLTSNAQTQLNGKASTTLNNLGTTAINADLLFADGTKNIGDATNNAAVVNTNQVTSNTNLSLNADGEIALVCTDDVMSLYSQSGSVSVTAKFWDKDSGFYAGIKSPDTLSANYTLVLPVDDGTAGQILSTNGSGVLSWVADASGGTKSKETFVLIAGDITAQLVTLAQTPIANSVTVMVKGSGAILEGASYDYTVSTNTIVFQNDLATGGASALIAGDVLQVSYSY